MLVQESTNVIEFYGKANEIKLFTRSVFHRGKAPAVVSTSGFSGKRSFVLMLFGYR